MKYPSPPDLPLGGTPASRLDMAFRKVLTVSKEELTKQEGIEKKSRKQPTLPHAFSLVRALVSEPCLDYKNNE